MYSEETLPLLSICIPTYNRAQILRTTLTRLVMDPAFGKDVEIIISDNASNDGTQEVGVEFASKYTNISYYRNSQNIRDRNFSKVLSYAKGKYIRLFNDTLLFKPNMLGKILGILRVKNENIQLFFFQNNEFHSSEMVRAKNLLSFVEITSFYLTWIVNFGLWKSDFYKLVDLNKHADLQLVQVDWLLQLASLKKESLFYFDNYLEVIPVNKKGGYNLFEVFIDNYFFILRKYLKGSWKSRYAIAKEKYRLFRHFILFWYNTLIISSSLYTFDVKSAKKIILKEYWYCPYIYPFIIILYLKKLIRQHN